MSDQPSVESLDELLARQVPVALDPIRQTTLRRVQSCACGATRELYPPLEGTLPVQLKAKKGDARARTRAANG